MKTKKITALILALIMLLSLCACGSLSAATESPATEAPAESEIPAAEPEEITITDMIGREVTVTPGS